MYHDLVRYSDHVLVRFPGPRFGAFEHPTIYQPTIWFPLSTQNIRANEFLIAIHKKINYFGLCTKIINF
jgi:hypothetical protein